MHVFYLSFSVLFVEGCINSNTYKYGFSSIWIRRNNDVMYSVDCVIKRDVCKPAENSLILLKYPWYITPFSVLNMSVVHEY